MKKGQAIETVQTKCTVLGCNQVIYRDPRHIRRGTKFKCYGCREKGRQEYQHKRWEKIRDLLKKNP